jgi:hypothetical protein
MNPSTTGWIKKLLRNLKHRNISIKSSIHELYKELRNCGFIYGSNVLVVNNLVLNKDLTNEERCKLNFFIALLSTYNEANIKDDFTKNVIQFYTEINEHKISIFDGILGGTDDIQTLEKIIHKRIQIDSNAITKSFNYFITNALLFVDILAYKHYLKENNISENYLKGLEATIETLVINIINVKENKTKYDESLLKLFEASMRYQNNTVLSYNKALLQIENDLEAHYLFDITCMTTWSDQKIDNRELYYLKTLGKDLKLKKSSVEDSINSIRDFFTVHHDNIALLSSKNIIQSFYSNSSKMVSKLISRNSKRLHKELIESKELMVLLTQSTIRTLTKTEHQQVQKQLFDIFKTIPSLAIFLLPGGALLLPLVVKFIPKLLPSAFDDNRIEDD